MKWSKRLESLTEKGEFSPHTWSISGHSPGGDIGYLLTLSDWYNPLTGFLPYEVTVEPQIRTQLLLCTCLWISFNQSHTQAHRRVSKVKQKTRLLGEQGTKSLSIYTLS